MENNSGHHCPIKVTVNVLPEEHRHLLSGKPLRSADRDEIARLNERVARLQAEAKAARRMLVNVQPPSVAPAWEAQWDETQIDYNHARAAVDTHRDLT